MRRAILLRFIGILMLALLISSAISYYFIGERLLENNISSMQDTIQVIDYALDPDKDFSKEVRQLHATIRQDARITIVSVNGDVLADTDTENFSGLENHLERKEISEAISDGDGFATRYSSTLKQNMLYVAILSQTGEYVIRMSIPYRGLLDYMNVLLPWLFAGVAVAFIAAVIMAVQFASSFTRPLNEISEELQKVSHNDLDFHFKRYQYKELNVISESSLILSREVREHLDQVEFERKIRQEFFSNASHELKTPITSIKGYVELLVNGFVKDEETKDNFMARILKETDNMTNLINDILMISQLETKEANVTYSMISMQPFLEDIMLSMEPIATEYGVSISSSCDLVTIEASAKQMRELIMNLVSNGIKYNRPGGRVWIRVTTEDDNMVLTVEDDGVGISTEDQERIFERFYRVDKGRSKKMGGTGLGLAIVKHIAEFNHGKIKLVSSPDCGSTFTIILPLIREED